jgi:hypothetical protein
VASSLPSIASRTRPQKDEPTVNPLLDWFTDLAKSDCRGPRSNLVSR